MQTLDKLREPERLDAARRAFVIGSGLATAGLASLGVLAATAGRAGAQAVDDFAILNFALNLEYLEAEFYLRAAFGMGLDDRDVTGTGTPGGVLGGRKVPFATAAIRGYAEEIADDEKKHVLFLRQVLGAAAVARPLINIREAFTKAARAAGVIGPGATFDAYANEDNFLLAAFVFEDVGVTAYKGAARLISNKDYLEAAAGILAVEAYHAGEIRTLLFARGLAAPAQKISDLRGALSNDPATDQGIAVNGRPHIVPALPASGIVPSRSGEQVWRIVYGGGAPSQFLFFPNKLNGALR